MNDIEDKPEYTFDEPADYAEWPAESGYWNIGYDFGTGHLPEHVVSKEWSLIVHSRTAKENPRVGSIQFAFKFGGRENPRDLSPDESAYVEAFLERVLDAMSAGAPE